MKRLIGLWASLGMIAVSIPIASAAGLAGRAYEPFNYASSPSPANQISAANNLNGSWGWNAGGDGSANALTGSWGNAAALPATGGLDSGRTISAPGLTYTATGYPASLGAKATIDAVGGSNTNVSRSIGQLVDSGSFYFSYLTKRNLDTMRTASLAFFGPTNGIVGSPGNTAERVSIGQIAAATAGSGTTSGNIGLLINNQNPARLLNAASPIAYGTNVTHLIAGRVDFNPTGNDTLTLYVDPTSMTAEPATPYIQTSAYELSSFNSIRLFAGNAATINGVPNAAASVDFDEIRIGSSWSDMISTAPATPKYLFTSIDYPGATATFANGISPNGDIVGEYEDSLGVTHPFIRTSAGVYSTFEVPNAFGDSGANGMNASGQVVGGYTGFTTTNAYIRTGGNYMDLSPFPGAAVAKAYSINDAGHVVGYYEQPGTGLFRGFLYDGTTYTELHDPSVIGTQAIGINNSDDIVGYYFDGSPHGYLYADGEITTLDYPLPGALGTVAQGINDAGEIAGIYFDSSDKDHGFLKTSTGYATIDYPGAIFSGLVGVNNAGQLAGYYRDDAGLHGYLAIPVADADFNGNGQVNGDDLAAWKGGFGLATGAAKSVGDANGDFDVDGADFLKWQTQLTLGGAALPAVAVVPEPAAGTLLILGGVGLARCVRRRPANA